MIRVGCHALLAADIPLCLCIYHEQLPDSSFVAKDANDGPLWLHTVQVNAAVGCLARMPLPHAAFKPPVQHPASRSSRGQSQQGVEQSASRFGSELWAPYLRDTALRVFGSVGVAGQLGHFCRPVLDFTAGAPALALHAASLGI